MIWLDEILTDEQISEMLEKIKSSFGEGEEETITENSYSFKNRALTPCKYFPFLY